MHYCLGLIHLITQLIQITLLYQTEAELQPEYLQLSGDRITTFMFYVSTVIMRLMRVSYSNHVASLRCTLFKHTARAITKGGATVAPHHTC